MSSVCESVLGVVNSMSVVPSPSVLPHRSPRLISALREIGSPCDSDISTPTEIQSPSLGELSETKRASKKRRSDEERKERHNNTERKGRQKINSEIAQLKDLLPEIQNSAAPKAAILQCAVDNLKRLQTLAYQLLNSNMQLKEENKKLWAEVNRLRTCLNPHDTFICDMLDQKLVEEGGSSSSLTGIALPSPTLMGAPGPALGMPSGQAYELAEHLPGTPPGPSNSRLPPAYYQLPSLSVPARSAWYQ